MLPRLVMKGLGLLPRNLEPFAGERGLIVFLFSFLMTIVAVFAFGVFIGLLFQKTRETPIAER